MLLQFMNKNDTGDDYQKLNDQIYAMVHGVFPKRLNHDQQEGLIFQHLDKALATKKSQFEARTYRHLLKGIQQAHILDKREIQILFNKAERFIDKKSVKKEKTKIKNMVQQNLIVNNDAEVLNKANIK